MENLKLISLRYLERAIQGKDVTEILEYLTSINVLPYGDYIRLLQSIGTQMVFIEEGKNELEMLASEDPTVKDSEILPTICDNSF